jgi:DNA primase
LEHVLETYDQFGVYDLYYVLNPVSLPASQMKEYNFGAKKRDVPWRRWFLLDGDPVRISKIATQEQFDAAREAVLRAKAWLESRGWSNIVVASSGNGCHLVVPCDLPNNKESEHLVKTVQHAVSKQFSSERVVIECFPDADRITRAYGTLNRKGEEDAARGLLHRRSGIIES